MVLRTACAPRGVFNQNTPAAVEMKGIPKIKPVPSSSFVVALQFNQFITQPLRPFKWQQ